MEISARPQTITVSFLLAATVLAVSCAPRKTVMKTPTEAETAANTETNPGMSPSVDVEEAKIHGKQFSDIADLKSIYFDYDKYALSPEARATLQANSAYLKAHPDFEVLVEGHCDDRGTIEYNLALGQKRAKEVRDYYVFLGVPAKSMGTISYGKEQPVCKEENDGCWSQNRRSETKIRALTATIRKLKTTR